MKKEEVQPSFDVEKHYDLGKYEKNDYTTLMMREFKKQGKKLQKIFKYEEMIKQGQTLSQEMKDLIGKKDQLFKHLDSLKVALDFYAKANSLTASGKLKEEAPAPKKDLETEIADNAKAASKTLGFFFAVASSLQRQEELLPNPFLSSSIPTPAHQAALQAVYKMITQIREEQETSLPEEAKRAEAAIYNLLTKSKENVQCDVKEAGNISFGDIIGMINQISQNSLITELKYRTYKKAETQILKFPHKELYMSQYFPDNEGPSSAPKEEKKDLGALGSIKIDKPTPQPVTASDNANDNDPSWVDADKERPKEGSTSAGPKEVPIAAEEEGIEDDEFTVAKDKQEERKKKVEDRGRYRNVRGGNFEPMRRGRGRAIVRRPMQN